MVYRQPTVVVEQPLVIPEPAYGIAPSAVYDERSGVYEEDARQIAMMHGLVSVDKVSDDWHGNYKVKGRDASGDRVVIVVDKDTGDVLSVDD